MLTFIRQLAVPGMLAVRHLLLQVALRLRLREGRFGGAGSAIARTQVIIYFRKYFCPIKSGKLLSRFPFDSPFSTDVHNLITWMLTPELAVRPHLRQIMDRLEDMVAQAEENYKNGTAAVVKPAAAAAADSNTTRT